MCFLDSAHWDLTDGIFAWAKASIDGGISASISVSSATTSGIGGSPSIDGSDSDSSASSDSISGSPSVLDFESSSAGIISDDETVPSGQNGTKTRYKN